MGTEREGTENEKQLRRAEAPAQPLIAWEGYSGFAFSSSSTLAASASIVFCCS